MTRLNPVWMQSLEYASADDRTLLGAMLRTPGVLGPRDLRVVAPDSGMQPEALPGQIAVSGAKVRVAGYSHAYLCTSTAIEKLPAIAIPAAPNSRCDLIYAQLVDPNASSGGNEKGRWEMKLEKGTEAPSDPQVPKLPTEEFCVPLAAVRVAHDTARIEQANITDLRRPALPAGGSVRHCLAYEQVTQPIERVVIRNIPPGYRDLEMVVTGQCEPHLQQWHVDCRLNFNDDGASNLYNEQTYWPRGDDLIQLHRVLSFPGCVPRAYFLPDLAVADPHGSAIIRIPAYSSTTQTKGIHVSALSGDWGNAGTASSRWGLWAKKEPIHTIATWPEQDRKFSAGTTVALYAEA